MRTVVDVVRAVSDWVEGLFGEPPTTKDIHQGFDRPCTYVQPVLLRAGGSGRLREDVFGLQVIRLAQRSQTGYLSLLQWQAQLREALAQPIAVSEDFLLFPEELSFELDRDDMALVAAFTVENAQLAPEAEDGTQVMERMEFTMRKDE